MLALIVTFLLLKKYMMNFKSFQDHPGGSLSGGVSSERQDIGRSTWRHWRNARTCELILEDAHCFLLFFS